MTDEQTTETETTEQTTTATIEETSESGDTLLTKDDDKAVEKPEPFTAEDITLPEGFELDDERMDAFVNLMNEGLSPKELAGKLIGLQAEMAQGASDSISDAWTTMQEEWKTASVALPDLGGDNMPATLGSIKELINEVMGEGAKDVFEAFDLTGMGNHPAMISLLARLAADRAEGKLTKGEVAPIKGSIAEQMFPNQGKT